MHTKLFIPSLRPNLVPRQRLIEQLNQALQLDRRLTLISAAAGFGKTTLASEWLASCARPSAWLSLDEDDDDPLRFLAYLITALQTLVLDGVEGEIPDIGKEAMMLLQSPQPPPIDSILAVLLNELTAVPTNFILVLDDFHLVNAQGINRILTYILKHQPPQMHLVIATREDPPLPLARLRARGQLTELRVADLRFSPEEAAAFLNQVMNLNLSAAEVDALERRTEGWIAGLQLAALSMQGQEDTAGFIESFSGSHHFVLDYLVEEVLSRQPATVQNFLLRTSILERLCAPLCDAVLGESGDSSQETLHYLERTNLFIVPLDNERRWYRYHHLFGDLIRRRLQSGSASEANKEIEELHRRASVWFEENGLEIEAFHHAVAANDVDRAARLVEGKGMPLHFRGLEAPVLNWLTSLPAAELDARPTLWVYYAMALTMQGRAIASVDEKLQAAETALHSAQPDDKTRDLEGQIASIRAMLAIPQYQVQEMFTHSRHALELLHPGNLPVRAAATWTLGFAHQNQGNHAEAIQAYTEAMAISEATGNIMFTIAAATTLGQVYEAENQLRLAAEIYERVQQLSGDPPIAATTETYHGLARILYEWNDLDAARQAAEQALHLARQMENADTPAFCLALLARIKLARGDDAGAAALLDEAERFMRDRGFADHMATITAVQVLTLLHQSKPDAAADVAQEQELPLSQARVLLALGETSAALDLIESLRRQVEVSGPAQELLKIGMLQALALQANEKRETAVQLMSELLATAEPGGFIRIFLDEGPPMARLLLEAQAHGIAPDYVRELLAAFATVEPEQIASTETHSAPRTPQSEFVEPLSERELEVLQLIAEGLTNQAIADTLYLSLYTVKAHARNIFAKLGVKNRTQAVAKAKALGILSST